MAISRANAAKGAGGLVVAVALAAAPLVASFEGDGGRRGYLDIVGVPTYCYGGTGPQAIVGKLYTKAECDTQLAKDVESHVRPVLAMIRSPEELPIGFLRPIASFGYNAGAANFASSTMRRKINASPRDLLGACDELLKWDKAVDRRTGQRVVLKGLHNRRVAERAACIDGVQHPIYYVQAAA